MLLILVFLFAGFNFYLIHLGARREHFGGAILETTITYLISNMPILFLIWASVYKGEIIDSKSFLLNIKTLLINGDVFIYVSAILAPVVWALIAYFRESHRVLTGFYLTLLIFILPFSAFSYQQARLTDGINQEVLDISAVLLYGVSLMLWYGAVVYTRFIGSYEPGSSSNPILNNLQGG